MAHKEKHRQRGHGWKTAVVVFLIVFIIFFGYAVLRYNIYKNVSTDEMPLYISNKAIASTAVALIGLSFLLGPFARFWPKKFLSRLYLRKYFGVLGFGMAAIHSVISLLLFSPAYYPRFFTSAGKLTLDGQFSMLFGILALFIFSAVSVTSMPSMERSMHPKQWLFVQRLGYLAFVLVLLHLIAMGVEGWLTPAKWPGGLLPISLLSALIIVFVLLIRAFVIFLRKNG